MQTVSEKNYELKTKLTDVYIVLILSVFVLFTGISGYYFLQMKKLLVFSGFTAVWGLGLAIVSLKDLRGKWWSGPDPVTTCIVAFALTALISTLCSEYGKVVSVEIGEYNSCWTYLLYAAVFSGVYKYGKGRLLFLWLAAAVYAVCCAAALIQLAGFNFMRLYPDNMNYYSDYVQETGAFLSFSGNIDVFSSIHCLALPLLISAMLNLQSKYRFLIAVPVVMGLVCVFMAGVASGILALVCTGALFLSAQIILRRGRADLGRSAEKTLTWKSFVSGWLLTVLSIAAAAVIFILILPFKSGTVYEMREVLLGHPDPSFGSSRLLIWREVWNVFVSHPVLGAGPGTIQNYLAITFERYSDLLGGTLVTAVDDAHNVYLQLLASFGIIGMIPLACAIAIIFSRVYRTLKLWYNDLFSPEKENRRTKPCGRILQLCLLLPSVVCYMIQAFFNLDTCITAPLFLIALALIASAVKLQL